MRIKFIFQLFFFLILFPASIRSQYPEHKLSAFRTFNFNAEQIEGTLRKAHDLVKHNPDSAIILCKQAVQQSKQAGYISGIKQGLSGLAFINMQKGYKYNEQALQYFMQLIPYYQAESDTVEIISTCIYVTRILTELGKNNEAIRILNQTIEYCRSQDTKPYLIALYSDLGSIYNNLGKFEKAFRMYARASNLAEKLNPQQLPALYNNQYLILNVLGNWEKALVYIDKSIEAAKLQDDYVVWSKSLGNKGSFLASQNLHEKAIRYFDSAEAVAREHRLYDPLLGILVFRMQSGNRNHQPEQALEVLPEALHLLNKPGITLRNRNLLNFFAGDAYLKSGKYKLAEQYLQAALKDSSRIPVVDHLAILHQLSELYLATGNYKKAYYLHQKTHTLNDSLKSRDIAFNTSELETRYRTAAKDKKIAQSQLQIIAEQKKVANKNNLLLSVSLGFTIIIMLLSWRYLYRSRKQQTEKEIERLKGIMEGEERERGRVAHDLHDSINSRLAATQSYLLALQQEHPYLSKSSDFSRVTETLKETSTEVRQIAHNLLPNDLLLKGLPLAVNDFCEGLFNPRAIRTDIQIFGEFDHIPIALSLTLYRISQELLHNIVKHAAATDVLIILGNQEGELSLLVEDNGKGITEQIKHDQGIGLSGLEKRVNAQNGRFIVESRPEQGTTIQVTFRLPTMQSFSI